MPRQRNYYRRETRELPDDFPQRLKRFQEESGLSWSELARRLGIYRHAVWRWKAGRARPSYRHRRALLELAHGMGLGYLFGGGADGGGTLTALQLGSNTGPCREDNAWTGKRDRQRNRRPP